MKHVIAVIALLLLSLSPAVACDGVPFDIVDQIKAKAASQFPDNYTLQEFSIKEECKAYLQVENYSDDRIPYQVLDGIIQKAASQFPDNYTLQKFSIDEEVKAYIRING